MHKFIIPLGGILAGSGVMTMLFGWNIGEVGLSSAEQISTVGFWALDEVSINNFGIAAFVMIFAGIVLMVTGNRTAWKETGGY